MSQFKLYPLNDFATFVKLKDISPTTGVVTPLTTGTVTAFLATSFGPTAVAADATLQTTAVHVGNGKWLVFLDAAVLTAALLNSKFASTPPYLIVQYAGGLRVYYVGAYVPSRKGVSE